MLIKNIPEILTWTDKIHDTNTIYAPYIALLSDKMGQTLAHIMQKNKLQGEYLLDELRHLTDVSFSRLLTAPETSYRLLWPARHSIDETCQFLRRSALAEMLSAGYASTLTETVWTALGDIRFSEGGKVFHSPLVEGLMPLDFESPYALNSDLSTMNEARPSQMEAFTDAEKIITSERLRKAKIGISNTDVGILEFVCAFTKVLMLQKVSTGPQKIFTRSPERYLGLSVFINPHLTSVHEIDIAEGLVHEAIHTLLDIDEVTSRMTKDLDQHWYFDNSLYDGASRAISPWTGSALALPTFFQAIFVWYGLLNFWCRAMVAGTFDPAKVKERIAQATVGFLSGPLLKQIADYRDKVCIDLINAVEGMQDHVTASLSQPT